MKKALFALGLLAVGILPGCGGDNSDCCRKEVQVKSYGKGVHTQAIDEGRIPGGATDDELDDIGSEGDWY